MVDLARAAGFVLLVGGLVIGFAVVCHSPRGLLVAATATAVPMIVLVLVAEVAAEPVFSWRPVARALSDGAPPEAEIVFEAPVEYQLVGGLAYYTARRITLLEVPGFVPPTYLAAERDAMFLSRAAFRRRWDGGEPLVLVSDPQRHRTAAAEIVPGPSHVIARFGDRWVLDNFAASR